MRAGTLDHREVAQCRIESMRHPPTLGDITARTAATGDVPGLHEPTYRVSHSGPRYVEALGELTLARQLGPRLQLRTGYLVQQLVTQPVGEQSSAGHSAEPTCGFRGVHQRPSPRGRDGPGLRWTARRAADRRRRRCRWCTPTPLPRRP